LGGGGAGQLSLVSRDHRYTVGDIPVFDADGSGAIGFDGYPLLAVYLGIQRKGRQKGITGCEGYKIIGGLILSPSWCDFH